jgi:hypothetical protein
MEYRGKHVKTEDAMNENSKSSKFAAEEKEGESKGKERYI